MQLNLMSQKSISPYRRNIFVFLAISIMVFSIYSNAFYASWHFDDEPNILNNTSLHLTELNLENIQKTFSPSWDKGSRLYRPMACLSFALNYYFGETEVFGYHLVNLIIHSLSAIFLFLFIYNALNLPILEGHYANNAYFIAFLATILWTINPIQVQSVTYIVQRMASMAGMFFIASLYFFLKGRTSRSKKLKIVLFLFCLFLAMLSLGSKENAIMLPVTILLFDLMFIEGITKRNLIKYAVFFLLVITCCLGAAMILKGPSMLSPEKLLAGYNQRGFSLSERLLTEPRILLLYISLIFYPMPSRLCFSHEIPLSKGLFIPPITFLAIFLIAATLSLAIVKSKKWPLLSFCILFFFLNQIIESSLIPLELVFEHRNYIPSMLAFVPVSLLIAKGISFFHQKKIMQAIIIGSVVLVLISFGHSTYMRNFVWQTEETLWLDAVEKNPNVSRGYHNLGKYFTDIGLKQTALIYYRKALELPESLNRKAQHVIHCNIGLIHQSFENFDVAKRHFLEAVKLEPGYLKAYSCLGIIALEEGNNKKAMEYFAKVLHYKPDSEKAKNQVGFAFLKLGQIDNAIDQFKTVLKQNPRNLYALTHLGVAYKYNKAFRKSVACFKKALTIENKYVTAALHLIEVYAMLGNRQLAENAAKALIKSLPPNRSQVLIEKRILQTDPLLAQADPATVLPVIKKVIQYDALKRR